MHTSRRNRTGLGREPASAQAASTQVGVRVAFQSNFNVTFGEAPTSMGNSNQEKPRRRAVEGGRSRPLSEAGLFLSVFLSVSLPSLLGMISGVGGMAARGVSMVSGFLVLSAVMMLGGFSVVARRVGMVFRGLPVVFGCFLRHNPHPPKEKSPARCPG